MSEIKKPEIMSQRRRYLCNSFYRELKQLSFKENLMKDYRVNERIARDVITEVANIFPVITPGKGYKIADDSAEDTLEEIHKWRDLDSRQREFEKRKKPLRNDIDRKMKERGIITLSEFERVLEKEKQARGGD